MKIRKAALVLTALLILPTLLLTSCGSAPRLEDVKAEFVALVEASYEVNGIFFGEGLPVYERDGDFNKENHIYDTLDPAYDAYSIVVADEHFYSIGNIKAMAEAVYSKSYLRGIYTMAFDGYAAETLGYVTTARYLEIDSYLLQYHFGEEDSFDLLKGKQRRYDFDTMTIVKPSSADYVNVKVDSYLLGDEENILPVTLRFMREDGAWRLDAPTY